MSAYKVAQNPYTKLWVVVGFAGFVRKGKPVYIPVSDGFPTKAAALKHIPHLMAAEASAKRELSV
jgi:hypothetical protein